MTVFSRQHTKGTSKNLVARRNGRMEGWKIGCFYILPSIHSSIHPVFRGALKIIFLLLPFVIALFISCTKEDGITPNWPKKADLPGNARETAVAFTIGNKAYIGTGFNGSYLKDFWEYDPALNSWTQKTDFGGTARYRAVGFSIGTKGYIGLGNDGGYKSDMWEYNLATNTWAQETSMPGAGRMNAVAFVIGNKAYIGTGWNGSHLKDIWEFFPDSSTQWSQKLNLPGNIRSMSFAFSIGNKGYLGGGYNYTTNVYVYFSDFYEYDPSSNTWSQKANFPTLRADAATFVIDGIGYVGTGYDGDNSENDFWEYDPVGNKWTQKVDFTGSARINAIGFSVNGKGYIGTGKDLDYKKDIFEYWP